MALWNPHRVTFGVAPSSLLSIELFTYVPIPEWGGAKLSVPLEDDAVVTQRGAEWLYPGEQPVATHQVRADGADRELATPGRCPRPGRHAIARGTRESRRLRRVARGLGSDLTLS